MKRVLQYLYLCSCVIILFFFGYVFWRSTSNTSHMEIISFMLTGLDKRVMILLGAVTILTVIVLLNRLISSVSVKFKYSIMAVLLMAGFAVQMFMIFGLRATLQYDSLKPVDVAMHMLNGHPLSASLYYDYFTIYPYNLSLVFFMMIVFKGAAAIGVSSVHYIVLLQFINALLIDASAAAMYGLMRRKLGEERAITFFLLFLFNPLTYYYPVFFYTKVLAGPFMVLLIYMFFQAKEAEGDRLRFIYGALYGVVLFFSMEVRTLSLIAPVACVITLILSGSFSLLKNKKFWLMLAVSAMVFVGLQTINDRIYESYGLVTDEEKAFPVHHWFMMGLKGDGKFDMEDFEFTSSFETKEERALKNKEVIIERIKALGPKGFIKLWGRKLANTWSDGYDDYADNLADTEVFEPYKDYLVDDRAELLAGYMHMFHCLICFLAVCAVVRLFWLKQPDMVYTMCITIVGGMIFHLFWESSETYSMPFALLLLATAAAGMNFIELPFFHNRPYKRYSWLLLAALLLADGAFLHHISPVLYDTPFETEEWAVNQNLREGESIKVPEGSIFTQTALVSRPFNHFTTFIKCDSKEEVSAEFMLRILASDGSCMLKKELEITNRWKELELDFEELAPSGKREELTIELTAPEDLGLSLLGYHTGNWDVYHSGSAAIDGKPQENTDLSFSLSNRTVRTFWER